MVYKEGGGQARGYAHNGPGWVGRGARRRQGEQPTAAVAVVVVVGRLPPRAVPQERRLPKGMSNWRLALQNHSCIFAEFLPRDGSTNVSMVGGAALV